MKIETHKTSFLDGRQFPDIPVGRAFRARSGRVYIKLRFGYGNDVVALDTVTGEVYSAIVGPLSLIAEDQTIVTITA